MIAITLGSGLGQLADEIDADRIIEYSDIDSSLKSTVEGHKGRIVIGKINGVDIAAMQGRIHYYEGYTMQQVITPIKYMIEELGVDKLILTNAAGGINESFTPGDLMIIRDHISSFVPSPLIGVDLTKETGARFHDMTRVYDEDMSLLIRSEADKLGRKVQEGVYLQTTGPNYETPAEIKAFRTLGADAVGMSTTVEAMYAHARGIRVCGVSCISNLAAGMTGETLSHEEVQRIADKTGKFFRKLMRNVITGLKALDIEEYKN
ncbi:MAG TPA: purine-nucleoside phosphorylase [Lachnospiraceae bacterium]|nr:purine-nucleoside phosphorylase [Lachnospiraceae bacterium]